MNSFGRAVAGSALVALLILAPTGTPLADECTDKAVSVGVSISALPYVFPEHDTGIEIDILRQALAPAGLELCPVYLPPSRAAQSFAQGRLDGLLNVREAHFGGYISDVIITFHNCAYNLARQDIPIDSINDLAGHSVAAFQRATTLLEPAFAAVVPQLAAYYEVPDQKVQLYLLFRGRVDLIVLDSRIYAYYHQQLLQQDTGKGEDVVPPHVLQLPVQEHCVFEPSAYGAEFADKAVRDAVNAGLRQLKASGQYQRIIDGYMN